MAASVCAAGADAYAGPAMEKIRDSVDMSVSTRRDTVWAPFFHLGFPLEPGMFVCLRMAYSPIPTPSPATINDSGKQHASSIGSQL